MKIWTWILGVFLCLPFYGQQLPVWENNIYWYNTQNTGRNFFNVWSTPHILPNGEVILKPYKGSTAKITANGYTDIAFENETPSSYISDIFMLKNHLFVILQNKIYRIDSGNPSIASKNTCVAILPEELLYHQSVIVQNNQAYIAGKNENTATSILYSFDGKSVKTLKKINGLFSKIGMYNGVQYWSLVDPKQQTHSFYTLKNNRLTLVKTLPFVLHDFHFNSIEDFYFIGLKPPYTEGIFHYKNGKISRAFPLYHAYTQKSFQTFFTHKDKQLIRFYDINKHKTPFAQTTAIEKVHSKTYSPETQSVYFGTVNDLARMFVLLKKYPRLYNQSNSDAIFSIGQTADGKVWTGSYNGYITTIDGEKQTQSKLQKLMPLTGGVAVGNQFVFNDETSASVYLFQNENQYKKIAENVIGFYNFISENQVFYIGANGDNGLMYKPLKDIENPKIPWRFAGKQKGIHLVNCLTVAEDRYGNIWTGHTTSGIAVYQPDKDKAKTWRTDKNEISFGSGAMLKDSHQTLWIATTNGKLYYWNGKHKEDFDAKNFIPISHPFFDVDHNAISLIHQWKDYLIIGKQEKLLLFDLKTWYQNRKVKVRYLNPMELSLSGFMGQNTIFTDKKDESIWFSTNTMLYNWNIKRWLELPTYPVKPTLNVHTATEKFQLTCNEKLELKPHQNSFDLELVYQAKDNMPRYTSVLLLNEKRNPNSYYFNSLNTGEKIDFNSIASGDYVVKVLVCQQDGSYNEYNYHIVVKKYWWEYWVFWAGISLFFIGLIYTYFRIKRKIEQQKTEIAQLNLITLSKQFRPHFMLNALNSLGSEMIEMPHAERIISRIGESINIMYSFIKKNKIHLPFEKEWKLTLNTIDIQKEIFIKDLQFLQERITIIPPTYEIPMGLLQIIVENALLHGIRHRKNPPYLLKITATENQDYYIISIEDNGVGKENSSRFIDSKKNGTGIKKIKDTIKIINAKIPNALSITFKTVNPNDKETPGTLVIIKMKKNINYEYYGL